MNNTELIDSLDDQHLLSLVELLSRALMMPEERLWYIANEELYYDLPVEIVNYCEYLSNEKRLKLMQLIINTLVAEAEKPAISMIQLTLPINSAISTTLKPVLPDY